MAAASPKSAAIVGLGNPLLDISTVIPDESLFDKYGLKNGNAILAEPKHVPLYAELVEKFPVSYVAGGATQNSIRVAQWMSGQAAGFTAYTGGVGRDAFGARLRAVAEADGVNVFYDELEAHPTGTCAVLVHGKERSLVANLAAADHYSRAHFESAPSQAIIGGADVIYSAGFFLTHAGDIAVECGKSAAARNAVYALNLSATFIIEFFKAQVEAVLPYADFVFCNETEAACYAKVNGLPADATHAAIARAIANLPKANPARLRHVVITHGAHSTTCVSSDASKSPDLDVPVPPLDKELIVDTNGAGDSMVGGFLAFIQAGHSIEEAIKAGHFAARNVLQHEGCSFDKTVKYVPEAK